MHTNPSNPDQLVSVEKVAAQAYKDAHERNNFFFFAVDC